MESIMAAAVHATERGPDGATLAAHRYLQASKPQTAGAADMPVKAPPPVAPAFYNWSGLYIGPEGGAIMGQSNHWSEIPNGERSSGGIVLAPLPPLPPIAPRAAE
jgi:hypothetical protein